MPELRNLLENTFKKDLKQPLRGFEADSLLRKVQNAMFIDKLTETDKKALKDYTYSRECMNYHEYLNKSLRGINSGIEDENFNTRVKELNGELSNALKKFYTPKDIEVYAAKSKERLFGEYAKLPTEELIGKVFINKEFNSTSLDLDVPLYKFLPQIQEGGVIFRTKVPEGTNAIYISSSDIGSLSDSERELLIDKGQKCIITGLVKSCGFEIIDCEIIPKSDKQRFPYSEKELNEAIKKKMDEKAEQDKLEISEVDKYIADNDLQDCIIDFTKILKK